DQHLTASSRLRREHRNSIQIMARSPLPGGVGGIGEWHPVGRGYSPESTANPSANQVIEVSDPNPAVTSPRQYVRPGLRGRLYRQPRLPSPLDLAVDALGDCFHGAAITRPIPKILLYGVHPFMPPRLLPIKTPLAPVALTRCK